MSTAMSTPTRPGAGPPAPNAGPSPADAALALSADDAPLSAWSTRNSPGWYRFFGAVAVAAAVTLAVVATAGAYVMRSSALTIQSNTAPSLIAVQGLSSSVAEANSTATAAFLSASQGLEDRQRRVAYLDALRRAAEQTEQVAGLIEDDEARHRNLKDVAVALTSFSGSIEASRSAVQTGQPDAVNELRSALDLTGNDVAQAVAEVTGANQRQFDDQSTAGNLLTYGAMAIAVIATLLLVYGQVRTARLSNRLLNPRLLLATLAIIGTLVVLIAGQSTRQATLANAEDGGYRAIAATSRLQSSANDVQTELSLRLLGGGAATDIEDPLARLSADVDLIKSQADSSREIAAADALAVRLERYRVSAIAIVDLADGGQVDAAVEVFQGSGFSAFNGLNTAIESVLSDNTAQFDDGIDGAASSVNLLPLATIILPLLAAIGIVLGIQRRLRDYQ